MREVRQYVGRRESFAFETTLEGKTYLKLIRGLLTDGWCVELIYLWLPSVELSKSRVAERVAHGGHNIGEEAIVRRYPKSLANLLNHFAPRCTSTICLDNSEATPKMIFTQYGAGRVVIDSELYAAMQQAAGIQQGDNS